MKKVHRRLTFEELRAFPGFENYTDEQAEETIKSLEALSILFYELHKKSLKVKSQLTSTSSEKEGNYSLEL